MALLKLNEMRSIIKKGHFNKRRHFNRGEQNERFDGQVAQEVSETFLFLMDPVSGEKVLCENLMKSPRKILY